MMCVRLVALPLVLAVSLSSLCKGIAVRPLENVCAALSRQTPPADDFPPNCTIQLIMKVFPGHKQFVNQAISKTADVVLIGGKRLPRLIDFETVKSTYDGFYRERSEIGVVAWAFTTAEVTAKAQKRLGANYGSEPDRFRFWQVQNNFVWLWCDHGVSDDCFNYFERLIALRVKQIA